MPEVDNRARDIREVPKLNIRGEAVGICEKDCVLVVAAALDRGGFTMIHTPKDINFCLQEARQLFTSCGSTEKSYSRVSCYVNRTCISSVMSRT